MRHTSPQLPLSAPWIAHAHAAELAAMSALLDEQPALSAGVQQDLEAGCPTNARTGRPGLSGEQTLRLLLVRQLTGWTYAELAFHLADSLTYRAFCRVSALTATPSKSVSVSAHVERWRDGTTAPSCSTSRVFERRRPPSRSRTPSPDRFSPTGTATVETAEGGDLGRGRRADRSTHRLCERRQPVPRSRAQAATRDRTSTGTWRPDERRRTNGDR